MMKTDNQPYANIKEIVWGYNILESVSKSIENHRSFSIKIINAGKHNHRVFEWISVEARENTTPQHGWKLHVSACLLNAIDILETILPALIQSKVNFKVAANLDFLAFLNNDTTKTKQAGKFITIYPENPKKAVAIAEKLNEITKHFHSPTIVTDKQAYKDSIIYYRYGAFTANYIQSLWGSLMQTMTINGKRHFDFKNINDSFMAEIEDPFTSDLSNSKKSYDTPSKNEELLKNRYFECATVNQTLSITVTLAIDLKLNRRCIIKKASRDSTVDKSGHTATSRLIIETNILKKLSVIDEIPKFIDDFYDANNQYCLVMEDIPGINLHELLQYHVITQRPISVKRVIKWAKELARIMKHIHEFGIIQADLKLGNLLLYKNSIKLIDFDSACDMGNDSIICGCGSTGFRTHNRDRGLQPVIQDDIYSYGAILYYLLGLVNPDVNPIEPSQHDINLRLLRENIPNYMSILTKKCLEGSFQNFNEINDYLDYDYKKGKKQCLEEKKQLSHREKLRFLVAEYTRKAYNITTKSFDLDHVLFDSVAYNDFRGIAGSILSLSISQLILKDKDTVGIIKQCTNQLLNKENPYNKIPGLYVGESGKALALLYAGYIIKDNVLVEKAEGLLMETNKMPLQSVDLFNGVAGRLRTNIIFWILTGKSKFLIQAKKHANHIVDTKITPENKSHVGWYNPNAQSTEDDFTFNTEILLGYAHGIAGIGDALIDYYLVNKNQKTLKTIQDIAITLNDQRQKHLDNKSLLWSEAYNGPPLLSFWCHGGAGIGVFLARAMRYGIIEHSQETIESIIHPITEFTKSSAPILCHGVAGNLECLLDIKRHVKAIDIDSQSNNFEMILSSWLRNYVNNDFRSSNVQLDFCGYLTGIAGIIALYSRLSSPVIPNPLHIEFAQYLKGIPT